MKKTAGGADRGILAGEQMDQFHRVEKIGVLSIVSGKMLIDDMMLLDWSGIVEIPKGKYPVCLTFVRDEVEERIIKAEINMMNGVQSHRKPLFDVSIDFACMIIGDLTTIEELTEKQFESLMKGTEDYLAPSYVYYVMELDDDRNLMAFSTGYGDGLYRVYGIFEGNTLLKIEIDFSLEEEDV